MVAGGCIETRKIMKITALETIRNAEFQPALLHIHTDEGLSGLGRLFSPGSRSLFHESVAPQLHNRSWPIDYIARSSMAT